MIGYCIRSTVKYHNSYNKSISITETNHFLVAVVVWIRIKEDFSIVTMTFIHSINDYYTYCKTQYEGGCKSLSCMCVSISEEMKSVRRDII